MPDALPYPRHTARLLIALLVMVLVWHLMLPGWFYRNAAIYLEGPLPAFLGAAFGLWLHRAETPRMQALGACGWAIFAGIVAIAVPGTAIFGPLAAIGGLYALVRDAFHIPFVALPRAFGSGYSAYVLWESIKTLLAWGAVAYVVLLFTRYDLKARLGSAVTDRREARAFTAEQRKQWAEYRKHYMAAVKAGGELPAAPAGLAPIGAAPAGNWHNRARVAYWVVRVGIAIAGLFGLWTAFNQQLFGLGSSIVLRGLFGGN